MEFSPANPVVQRCLHGMALEDAGDHLAAAEIFIQAWQESSNNFEKFLTSFYLARHQNNVTHKLNWLITALQLAEQIHDDRVKSAITPLHNNIAACYDQLNDPANAKKYRELAKSYDDKPTDKGPFYHGTKAELKVGDSLNAGFDSNYKSDLKMNHIYFTALINGAGLAAALSKGDGPERVYIVEPTGIFENDPNVTNNKFPGNPTRSYRTEAPLRIVGEVPDWARTTADEKKKWQEKLANNTGKIIN